jgi:hypothetical protein
MCIFKLQEQTETTNAPWSTSELCNSRDEIDSFVMSNILEMGYTESQIRQAFTQWRSQRNHGNITQMDLVEILLQHEDETSVSCDTAPENHGSESVVTDQSYSSEALSNGIDNMQLSGKSNALICLCLR